MRKDSNSLRFYTITTVGGETTFYWHDTGNVFVGGIMLGRFLVVSFVVTFIEHRAPLYLFFGFLTFTVIILLFLWFRNYWRIRLNQQTLTLQRGLSALTNTGGRSFRIAEIGTISSRTARGPADDDGDSLEVIIMQLRNGKRIRIGNSMTYERAKYLLQDLKPFVSTGGKLSEFKFSLSTRILAEIAVMVAAGLLIGVSTSEDFDTIKSTAMKVATSLGGYSFMFLMLSRQEHYEGKRFLLYLGGLVVTSIAVYLIHF
jgi:hypothetical protein